MWQHPTLERVLVVFFNSINGTVLFEYEFWPLCTDNYGTAANRVFHVGDNCTLYTMMFQWSLKLHRSIAAADMAFSSGATLVPDAEHPGEYYVVEFGGGQVQRNEGLCYTYT